MAYSWGNHSFSSLHTSVLISSCVTLTDIMENGFLADGSNSSDSIPFNSHGMESDQFQKIGDVGHSGSFYVPCANSTLVEIIENGLLAEMSLHSPSCHSFSVESALKNLVSDSSRLICDEMQKSFSTSEALAAICKTPLVKNAPVFDLSLLASEHNSRFSHSILDYICDHKISTPCKCKEKPTITVENQASKCLEMSEVLVDLSGLQKPTRPLWEISRIDLTLDNTLPLDTSVEDLGSPSSMLVDYDASLSREMSSMASALSFHWSGARPRKPSTLSFKSFAYETQSREAESRAFRAPAHYIKEFDFAIPSPDDRGYERHHPSKSKF